MKESFAYVNSSLESLNVLERFGNKTDTQAIDVVTFDFMSTRVRCFVSGSTDEMNFF